MRFAHTIQLEKVAWSILAELAIYQDLSQRKEGLKWCKLSERIEMLAGRWRKLVLSYSLTSRRNASKPLGLSMTYGQMLNIDYLVLSAILVLMKG